MRVAEDKIKITVPDVETFRSLNKYLIKNKIQFHTYALEEERKLKVVIRGVPEDICTDDIKSDLVNQGFPVVAVYRITQPSLATWLCGEATYNSKVCGLSGIRVEAPPKRGVPSQCHRCQHECSRSKDLDDKPACVNCGQEHTANYRGCPKAPKVVSKPTNRTDKKLLNNKKAPPTKDALNFPALGAKKSPKTIDDMFAPRLCPPPIRGLRNSSPGLNRNRHGRQTAVVHPSRLPHVNT
ncbi:Nucleic-acid-binding protein from transposon X-element [Eumeta japonica]|uniref:Nucleic-acid-binding protein from transposon X-element n=1 Tax=Eumeta variegata TaxID=151549 RepID=A0A4C1Z638_EUMVA|nr:Nucleic-acid-binding protein from transposon X-element [Eumeta japonica]